MGVFSLHVAVFVLMAAYNRNETERGVLGHGKRGGAGCGVGGGVGFDEVRLKQFVKDRGQGGGRPATADDRSAAGFRHPMEFARRNHAAGCAGLFGYRLDSAEGARYWGAVGQSPMAVLPARLPRHSGYGIYAGMLVLLVGLWALKVGGFGIGRGLGTVDRRW